MKSTSLASSAWCGLILWNHNKTSEALECLKNAKDPTDPITLFTLASLLGLTRIIR